MRFSPSLMVVCTIKSAVFMFSPFSVTTQMISSRAYRRSLQRQPETHSLTLGARIGAPTVREGLCLIEMTYGSA
jgi:hypothetical protein